MDIPEIKKVLSIRVSLAFFVFAIPICWGIFQVHNEIMNDRELTRKAWEQSIKNKSSIDSLASMSEGVHNEIHELHGH